MRVKFQAFPAAYLNIHCEAHNAKVKAIIEAGGEGSGASITSVACSQGGVPSFNNCQESWVLFVNAPGPVTIVP